MDALSKTTDADLINEIYTTLMTFILEAERLQGSGPALNVAGSDQQSAGSNPENPSPRRAS